MEGEMRWTLPSKSQDKGLLYILCDTLPSQGLPLCINRVLATNSQLRLPMQLPRRLRPAFADPLCSLPLARPWPIILIPDIICQVAGGNPLGLTYAISQPQEPIAIVHDLPVVCARFPHCLEIVQRAARPGGWDTTIDLVIVVRGAAAITPDGALHEGSHVRFEVSDGGSFRGHAVDGLCLVAVNEGEDIVGLCFNSYKRGTVRHRRVWAEEHEHVRVFGSCHAHI